MKMYWILFPLLILLNTGILHTLPTPVAAIQYETGTAYKYNYEFTVLLNEDSNITSRSASVGRHVGYKVSTDFLITNIWQNSANTRENLLKVELLKPVLHVSSTLHDTESEIKHWSKLDNLSYPPLYIHWNNGLIKFVYLLPDVESMVNIKKGLASLFQLHVTEGSTKELDACGLCEVNYKAEGKTVKKTKRNCKGSSEKRQKYSADKLRSSTSTAYAELLYKLSQEGVIQSVDGTEELMFKLNMWTQAAVFIKSKVKMELVEKLPDQLVLEADNMAQAIAMVSKDMGAKVLEDSLEVTPKETSCADNCKPLNELIYEYASHLHQENMGQLKSVLAFLKVLEGFRKATRKELLTVFKNAKEQMLIPLMDILAASQTEASLDVAFELIDFGSDDIVIPERFLLCLASSPFPTETVLRKTLKLSLNKFRSEKLHATVLIALSSILRSFCKHYPEKAHHKIVNDTIDVILKGLPCNDVKCVLIQLYAMRNAAHPRFISFLLQQIPQGGNVEFSALQALEEIGVGNFNSEVIAALERVYSNYWHNQDTASRVLASKLLVEANPSVETVQKLILSLSDREFHEVTTLVLATLYETAKKNHHVEESLKQALQTIAIGNYNTLAQNGSSTTYTRLLHAAHDSNITYGINLEVRKTGMLKRTSMDLKIENSLEEFPLLSIGLYVNGFGLTEDELKAMEVPEENSVGMELSVFNVHLRPYTFFTGTSELMGLVWSGVGSDPTSALQANFLLMDERKTVVLQNGISVDFVLKGAVSSDVSGTMEVSMWNKNAHALVRNKAALLVQGFCQVDTSFVESHVDFALGGNMGLNAIVNLDYSHKPMKMCLQMEQPEFNFRHNVRKTETIPGSKHLIKTVKRRSIYFPGRSLALHKKNYDSCRKLLFPKHKASYW